MPIRTEWQDTDKTIIHWIFSEEWTLDELQHHLAAVWNDVRHLGGGVDTIVTASPNMKLPKGNLFNMLKYILDHKPNKHGLIVFASSDTMMHRVFDAYYQAYLRLYPQAERVIYWVDNYEQALAFITSQQHYSSLTK